MGYGVGLMGLVGVKVLAPGFYARQDIRTPVRIAVVVLAATQAMNLRARALARPRRAGAVDRPGRAGQRGLAAARPAAAAVSTGRGRAGAVFAARVLLACAALGALLVWAGRAIDWIGLQAALGSARRAGWRRCWPAAALLYFGVLAHAACVRVLRRLAHFRRRA